MKLVDMTVSAFTEVMASGEPAPGGGSAAALNGAIGAGLASMVCALTIGKKKYAAFEEQATEAQARAQTLKDRFVAIIDSDTDAFNAVTDVFAMPKTTDEEKAARAEAMQQALKRCTVSPFEMMELAAQALEIVRDLVGNTNATAASDLGCAALNLKSAIQCAWLNVRINIDGLKDREFAEAYRAKGEAILAKTLPMADEVYAKILETM